LYNHTASLSTSFLKKSGIITAIIPEIKTPCGDPPQGAAVHIRIWR
jgi:hypothetical protein